MKILQISSDWKWTGSAAPMLDLAVALRAGGCDVEVACPEPPAGATPSLAERVRDRGLEPVIALRRARGVSPWRDRSDVRRLRDRVAGAGYDVVHTWHSRDHVLVWRALAQRRRDGAASLVRSHPAAGAIAATPWNRWLFGSATDGLVCVSPATAAANRALRGGRPLLGAFGTVDAEAFSPAPPDATVRASLGLAGDHRVVAIVARAQPHRRFDLLLEATRRLVASEPRARLLVIGRGTRLDALVRRPAERLGLADHVVLAGYRDGDYADVLRTADLFTLLVPGSDGTCRALLEAAACGLPAVTTRRGALAEIVVDSETGAVVDEAPEALAAAWGALLRDDGARRRMGAAARSRALQVFSPERRAEEMLGFYRLIRER